MDYIKDLSYLKQRKQSMSSNDSTSSSNSLLASFHNIEDDEFRPPKLRSQRKISVEEKIPEKYKEVFPFNLAPNSKRKESDQEKSITQKIKEFLGPKPKEKKEENILAQDEKRTIEEIITSKGFKCETHFVTTEDGYKLKIFRIPGDKNENIPDEKRNTFPPVLLQHGIFDSSDGWVCNGEEHSIAFVLAKNNFDVWLSNSRGNKYCKSHEKYNSQNYEFWQFSFNEMGLYDIPAVIKYIKEKNKSNEKIIYFGHSQGTTSMFSGLIQKYDFYKENIKLFVALAPIARLNHLDKLLNQIELLEICPNSEGTQKVLNFMDKYANGLTNFVLGLISDEDSKQCNDKNAMSVYLNHYPCGCSLKCLIHFIQIIENKKFIFFDYQKEANFHIYNQITPPEYDFSKIKDLPIILIGGENDKLSTREDIKWLVNELNENVIYAKIVENMGHLSFLIGKDFTWFNDVLKIIIKDFYVEKAL